MELIQLLKVVVGRKSIYLPWYKFNNNNNNLYNVSEESLKIEEKYHPYWHNLKQGARKLMGRNSYQVLGLDLKTPTNFILCYTKGGKGSGGTGQALRIAKDYNIPIFDFGKYDTVDEMKINFCNFFNEIGGAISNEFIRWYI